MLSRIVICLILVLGDSDLIVRILQPMAWNLSATALTIYGIG